MVRLSLILVFFLSTAAQGASNPDLEAGINSFQAGKFDEAKSSFVKLYNNPKWQFTALYNLGNVAARQSHLGEALGYYTRASEKNPWDKDTRENIKFVVSALGGRRLTAVPGNYTIFRTEVLDRFTFDEGLAFVLIFSAPFLIGLLSFIRRRKKDEETVLPVSLVIWGVLLVFITSLTACKLIDTYSERAIVILDHVDLKSGPSETNATMQQASEGSEVDIHDHDHEWVQVSLPGSGPVGWVPQSSLMMISGGGPF